MCPMLQNTTKKTKFSRKMCVPLLGMTKLHLVKLNFPLLPGAPGTFSATMPVSVTAGFPQIFQEGPSSKKRCYRALMAIDTF